MVCCLRHLQSCCYDDQAPQEEAMLKQGQCPQCSSQDIMSNVRIKDRNADAFGNEELGVVVDLRPHALVFKERIETPLRAWICGACGYTELYVDNPRELW